MTRILFITMALLLDLSPVLSQHMHSDVLGKWSYELEPNIFGEFSGVLEISLDEHGQVKGVIRNSYGREFWVKILRVQGQRIVFKSNFENSDATFFCNFSQRELKGVIEVEGDTYLYLINGERVALKFADN